MIDFAPPQSSAYDRTLESESAARTRSDDYIAQFKADMFDALMTDPTRLMRTGHRGMTLKYPACDIFGDNLDTETMCRLIKLLADAAKGQDVQLRALEMLSSVSGKYGKYHGADAAEDA